MVVGLVACCREKSKRGAPAAALYQAPGFRAAMRHAEARCDAWAILSGLHGLVLPAAYLEPYDFNLDRAPRAYALAWANRVAGQLRRRWPRARFLVLASGRYLDAVKGRKFEAPLEGINIRSWPSKLKSIS